MERYMSVKQLAENAMEQGKGILSLDFPDSSGAFETDLIV